MHALSSWEKITNVHLNQLINAMAAWNGYADFDAQASQTQRDELDNLIAACWQPRYY